MKRRTALDIKEKDLKENKRFFLVSGMEGVGKTTLVLDYIRENYEKYLYIDGTEAGAFMSFYEKCDEINVKDVLSDYFQIDTDYLINIPVIIDEPCEKMSQGLFKGYNGFIKLFVITPDEESAETISKDIDKELIFRMRLKPLDFGEFLTAIDKEWYAEVIEGHLLSRKKIPEMIHDELSDLFELFLQTGGMPEVINEYLKTQETYNISSKQKFVKYGIVYKSIFQSECRSRSKVKTLWDAMENVLEKDNHKFMFSSIRDGACEKEFEEELKFLISRNLIIQVKKFDIAKENKGIRYYYSDTALYERPDRRKTIESLLIQEINNSGTEVFYWESGKGASVDMVLKKGNNYIPVELKTTGKSNLRSVRSFLSGMDGKKYISISNDNCRFEDNVIQVPIYSAYSIHTIL